MIAVLYNQRQRSVTQDDITKHNNSEVHFYSISQMTTANNTLVSSTTPFSNSVLIAIDRGANWTTIGDERQEIKYRRTSPMSYEVVNGKGLIYWTATRNDQTLNFVIVKLISEDGCVQIKIIPENSPNQTIHNVCELPSGPVNR
ncbi:hypothetical protein C8P68_104323 [Mucilaginibacter yixingensis]|uniref:Uncharacterized protein n=2 Tax=Mucilaginibacter yixingensis TaxID=1295612 RepID=A0A2T5J9U0_9SPHI|nr:hypothetical protein C8P68_104323 [Mucilaginibacter yixingensis]